MSIDFDDVPFAPGREPQEGKQKPKLSFDDVPMSAHHQALQALGMDKAPGKIPALQSPIGGRLDTRVADAIRDNPNAPTTSAPRSNPERSLIETIKDAAVDAGIAPESASTRYSAATGTLADNIDYRPTRTMGELATDLGVMWKQGARYGVSQLAESPWTATNAVNAATNDAANAVAGVFGQKPSGQIPMVQAPQALRDFRQMGKELTDEERLQLSGTAAYDEANQPSTFGGTVGELITHPGAILAPAAQTVGAMIPTAVAGGGNAMIALGAAQQAQQAAEQVYETLKAEGVGEQEARAQAARSFTVAAGIGAVAPNLVKGGRSLEDLMAGKASGLTGSRIARAAVPLTGEAVSEGGEEGAIQIDQNAFTGRPLGEGVGNASALGAILGAGMGAPGAISELSHESPQTNDVPLPEQPNLNQNALSEAIGQALRQVSPAPAAPAPPSSPATRTGAEAGAVIDKHLEELGEAAKTELPPERVQELQAELKEAEAILKEHNFLRDNGVLIAPEKQLSEEDRAYLEKRRVEIRAELEKGKAGASARQQREKLETQLQKTDTDAGLIEIAHKLSPPVAYTPAEGVKGTLQQSAGKPTSNGESRGKAEAEEGASQEGGQVGEAAAGRASEEATDQQEEVTPAGTAPAVPAAASSTEPTPVQTEPTPATGTTSGLSPRLPGLPQIPADMTLEKARAQYAEAKTDDQRAAAAGVIAAVQARDGDTSQPIASRAKGAGSAPLRAAVDSLLGTQSSKATVHATTADIPADVRKRNQIDDAGNDDVEGFYDAETGEVHIIESGLDTARMPAPVRAAWVAAHELAGHGGLRGMTNGYKPLAALLKRAHDNDVVRAVAKKIQAEHGYRIERAVEEAVVEIGAAIRTGNFAEIEKRYRVTVPEKMRENTRGLIERIVKAIREFFGDNAKGMTDADVYDLIDNAWKYVQKGGDTRSGKVRETVAQRAFHGTREKGIAKFSMDKIGTGEGNQSYGHGLYFAGNREVAENYRKGLRSVSRKGGRVADLLLQAAGGNRVAAIEEILRLRRMPVSEYNRKTKSQLDNDDQKNAALKDAEAFIRADSNRGQLYQQELPEDHELLSYDLPLSEQSPEVKAALRNVKGGKLFADSMQPFEDTDGSGLYYALSTDLGSNKAASEALAKAGVPGLRYLDGGSRVAGKGTHNYVIWDESRIGEPEGLIASRRTSSGLLRNLTEQERGKVTEKTAAKIVDIITKLPSRDEMAAVAHAGRAKRGWYAESAKAISAVFGADAPRFAGLLAAMSPQTSVESNLRNALNTWANWIDAGRPTDREDIIDIMGRSVEGSRGRDSVLGAWINNSVTALAAEDPTTSVLSGPKVDSFMRNLVGNVEEVTNDAWMANYSAIEQTLFKGQRNKKGADPGKGSGYLAMNARVRDAADRLSKLTGEKWTPAEVQETIWSWAKTLYEMADDAGEIRTAKELIEDRAVTDELIRSTPDFGTLFADPTYAKILEGAGYEDQIKSIRAGRAAAQTAGEGSQAGGQAGPFAEDTQRRHELRAAARLDSVRRARKDKERELAAKAGDDFASDTDPEEDIPFSRRKTKDLYGEDRGADLVGMPNRVRVGGDVVAFHGYAPAQEIAAKYAKKHGNELPRTYAPVDEARAKRIADAYDKMEHAPQDPDVKAAYAAMIDETLQQYKDILRTGIKIEFIDGPDPYAESPRLAIMDVVENNHLWVFPTEGGFGSSEADVSNNPLLAPTPFKISGKDTVANDIFRVVHDYFGHIANGVGFRADGEENAWREHSAMYSPLARRAMTSETRGQNSWVNYGPHGKANQTASSEETVYADQKAGLLPQWVSEEGREDEGPIASRKKRDLFPNEMANGKTTVETNRRSSSRGPADAGGSTDSKGKIISPTKQGLKNFWNWFGDSKVVDENGAPIQLYHSTAGDFDTFETGRTTKNNYGLLGDVEVSRSGIFMTPDIKFSETFIEGKDGGAVMPLYARIENPLDLRNGLTYEDDSNLMSHGFNTRMITRANTHWELFDNDDDGNNEFVDALREAGYDGAIIYESSGDDTGETYIALDPKQVKSATGNVGAFNADDDSIIASRGFSAKKRQPDATSVDAYHYSPLDNLKKVDPRKAGSNPGHVGKERRRFGVSNYGANGGTSARAYFYVRNPGDPVPVPESMVGGNAYHVQLDNLYDVSEDPRGFSDEAGINPDYLEDLVSDAGFDGTVHRDTDIGAVATVFDIGNKSIPVRPADDGPVASRAQTRTPAFRNWFGESEVIDSDGQPLVVYHGSQSSFSQFDGRKISWFSERPETADRYSINPDRQFEGSAPQTYAAYLSIQNPAHLSFDMNDSQEKAWNQARELGIKDPEKLWPKPAPGVQKLAWNVVRSEAFQKALKAHGFDGMRVREKGAWTWGAFEPSQIKSATGNGGQFHADSGDIIASRRVTPAQKLAQRQQLLGTLNTAGFGANPQQPVYRGPILPLKAAADATRTALQDKMLPLLRAQQAAATPIVDGKGITSLHLSDDVNAYRLETLMHGAIKDGIEGADHDFIKPLQAKLKNFGMLPETLEGWLLARTAEDINKRVAAINSSMPDGGSGINTADAHGILAGTVANPYTNKVMTPDELRQAASLASLIDGMRLLTLDNMVAAGQITARMKQELLQRYPFYVPARGKDGVEPWHAHIGGTGKGLGQAKANIKYRTGRGAGNLPVDILGELASDLQKSIVAKGKAKVNQALLRFLIDNPMPEMATVEPVDMEWKYSEATGEAYPGVKSSADDVSRSIIVMHNGEQVRIRFEDEALRDAVMNLGVDGLQFVVKYLGWLNRYRSAVLTRFNPGFTPVNIVRDVHFGLTALAAEHGPVITAKVIGMYNQAAFAIAQDNLTRSGDASVPDAQKTMADWARDASERGMKTGLTSIDDVANLQKEISVGAMTVMQMATKGKPGRAAIEAAKRTLAPLGQAIENINDAYENALRLSAYVALVKSGMTKDRAAEYAKNLTINFNRKGKYGSAINSLFLFYNASVQGTHAVARVLSNPKVVAYLSALGVLQGIFAGSLMDDDDDDGVSAWDGIPDYVKRTSLILPLGLLTGKKGDYASIPMPYGFNLFTYAGSRTEQFRRLGQRPGDSSFIGDMLKSTVESFSPLPLYDGYSSLFGDQVGFAMQLAANKDDAGYRIANTNDFSDYDAPMATSGNADTARIYQTGAQMLAKLGGGNIERRIPPIGFLDVAPEQIEAVTGYLGGGILSLVNKGMRWWDQMDATNLESEMDQISAAPIASRFVGTPNEARAIAERYYFERGDLARRKDIVADRIDKGEDPAAVLADEAYRSGTMRGFDAARYKRDTEKNKVGDIKRTTSGKVQLEARADSFPKLMTQTDMKVKGVNKAVKALRDPELTNAEAVALVAAHNIKPAEIGLPDRFTADVKAPTRVRMRAIKLLQDKREADQKEAVRMAGFARTLSDIDNKGVEDRGR